MQNRSMVKALLPDALLRRYRAQPEGLRIALRNLRREIMLARFGRASARGFRELRGRRDLRVHLGCGALLKSGWVNIDLTDTPPPPGATAPAGTIFINHDLRRGLPLDDASCAMIYSAHFFEHLEYRSGVRLLQDCHRVLQPGGVFRAGLPDFKGMFRAYLEGRREYFSLIDIRSACPDVEPGTETLVDHVNYGVYQSGEHKCIYDEEKFLLLLRRLGYRSVSESSFQGDIDPDAEERRRYSFWVEAVK